MTVRRLAPVLLAAAALLAGGAGAPGAQAMASPTCPAKAGTLFHSSYGRAWHAKGSLYSCTTVYGHKRVVRLGPWRTGGKLAWTPTQAVWSVPLVRDGRVVGDRVSAGSTEDGSHWLVMARALSATEGRVQRLFSWDVAAGWVTTDGTVVFGLRDPQDQPTAIGALPGGPPVARSHMIVVGRWTGLSPTALGRTVKIDSAGGDGDECGGAADYRLTLAPDPAAPDARVGVSWFGGWTRPFCG